MLMHTLTFVNLLYVLASIFVIQFIAKSNGKKDSKKDVSIRIPFIGHKIVWNVLVTMIYFFCSFCRFRRKKARMAPITITT